MIDKVRRVFVEKKSGFDVEARGLFHEFEKYLRVRGLEAVRVIIRYDIEGICPEDYQKARDTVFAEPPVDFVFDEALPIDPSSRVVAMEYLPGQYDQRADSAAQCIQILTQQERPPVRVAKLIVLEGKLSEDDYRKIKEYCINRLESQEASLEKPPTLSMPVHYPADVKVLAGFLSVPNLELQSLRRDLGLAMSEADLFFCRDYFRDEEKRNPTLTEIRVLDTYWSDHCRHTTFLSQIENVELADSPFLRPLKVAYQQYLESRRFVYGDQPKDVCLMDIATMAMKEMRKRGQLPDLDLSEEVNACSIRVQTQVDGEAQEWLVMFKNETHNHPTEIEPFGGAATCLGGAIRDPLSGRSYVYQAMRVTGSGDPRIPIEETLPGKLPQSKITRGAAAGFSSYGNQIGLATGQVAEIYDPGFVAKRMEIGAVIGAAPRANIVREKPQPGDAVILLGGRTGRDGCGGATGSSKEHTEKSLLTCGAEVQKGNPPTERKLQRLFRTAEVSRMIRRCNDFGAGGVAVAIGELTDGLEINLDAVPKKYEGLDGTELAISESQERMAVVVTSDDVRAFCEAAANENLEATPVAVVTADARLKMLWRGKTIVDVSRAFLNTNGVKQSARVAVAAPDQSCEFFRHIPAELEASLQAGNLKEAWLRNLERLEVCSQKGLVERFDSTIGAGSVLLPFGGRHQLTPAESMAAKLPLLDGDTSTGTLMAHGYNPAIAKWSPFHGAVYAIVEAVAKIVATGGDFRSIRLTLQEYFEKPGQNSEAWGKPFAALLGAYWAQVQLGIPAIGGKDSMSGTFKDMTVPPTLVAFAVCVADVNRVISPEFKQADSSVLLMPLAGNEEGLPDFDQVRAAYTMVHQWIKEGRVLAAHSIRAGGLAEAVTKMCLGNGIGFFFEKPYVAENLFRPEYGSLVLELREEEAATDLGAKAKAYVLGKTIGDPAITVNGTRIELDEALRRWTAPLESIFPTKTEDGTSSPRRYEFSQTAHTKPAAKYAKPRILMPVFPGTNCEYDTMRAFQRAGGQVETLVFRNLVASDIETSLEAIVKQIEKAQIVMLPGGFSAGDEPEGSGKFIATVFRNPRVKEAVSRLLKERDGLILGICNGFQALVKLGLVPYGEIRDLAAHSPTLTYNTLGRHVSCMVQTRVASNLSPWLWNCQVGEIHTIAISHGEGRFVASPAVLEEMVRKGQVATQYVDLEGNPSADVRFNPNGSVDAVEGITSPDGRVFGKMGHSERMGNNVAKNVPGNKDQKIFEAGVAYFR